MRLIFDFCPVIRTGQLPQQGELLDGLSQKHVQCGPYAVDIDFVDQCVEHRLPIRERGRVRREPRAERARARELLLRACQGGESDACSLAEKLK